MDMRLGRVLLRRRVHRHVRQDRRQVSHIISRGVSQQLRHLWEPLAGPEPCRNGLRLVWGK